MAKYTCWHGEAYDRMNEEQVSARDACYAAESFAIGHDEGDDYDIVFVQDGDVIREYRCVYIRETRCDTREQDEFPLVDPNADVEPNG